MPAPDPAPRRRKPRRFTAEPQRVSESTLVGVFEMPHGAGRPEPEARAKPAEADAPGTGQDGTPGSAATSKAPEPATAEPVLKQRAAEDDPRAWGDGDDDLGEWLKSQRPPHWD